MFMLESLVFLALLAVLYVVTGTSRFMLESLVLLALLAVLHVVTGTSRFMLESLILLALIAVLHAATGTCSVNVKAKYGWNRETLTMVLARTASAPLERLKLVTMLGALHPLFAKEGGAFSVGALVGTDPASLWSGNMVGTVRAVLANSLYRIQKQLPFYRGSGSRRSEWLLFAWANAVPQLILNPLDVIGTLQSVEMGAERQRSVWELIGLIYQRAGATGLWSGFLIGVVVTWLYRTLVLWLFDHRTLSRFAGRSWCVHLYGMAASVLTYPLDVLRRVLILQLVYTLPTAATQPGFSSYHHALLWMWRGGWGACFGGLGWSLLRSVWTPVVTKALDKGLLAFRGRGASLARATPVDRRDTRDIEDESNRPTYLEMERVFAECDGVGVPDGAPALLKPLRRIVGTYLLHRLDPNSKPFVVEPPNVEHEAATPSSTTAAAGGSSTSTAAGSSTTASAASLSLDSLDSDSATAGSSSANAARQKTD